MAGEYIKICPQCGTKVPAHSVFCDNCGTNLKNVSVQRNTPEKTNFSVERFCSKCGRKIPANVQFCRYCGATANQSTQRRQNNRSGAPVYAPSPNMNRGMRQMNGVQTKKKSGKALIAVLLVVVLGVVAFTGFVNPGFLRFDQKPGTLTASITEKTDTGSTDGKNNSVPDKPLRTEKAELSKENPEATLCGITIETDTCNLDGEKLSLRVDDYGTGVSDEGASFHQYDISLGDKSEYDAATALTFPCEGDPENYVILHEDHETDGWIPMVSFPDQESSTVTVYTDSFSNFRATLKVDSPLFFIANEGRPDATVEVSQNYLKILESIDPEIMKQVTESFAVDPLEFKVASEGGSEGTSKMEEFLTNLSGPLAEQIGGVAELDYTPVEFTLNHKTYEYYGSQMKSDLSTFMTGVTVLNIGLKLCKDVKNHGINSETTAANLIKNIATNGSTFYGMATGYSSAGLTFSFLGVALLSMEIDAMTETAQAEQQKYMKKLMDYYYENVKPFDADYWYKQVNSICDRKMISVQDAVAEVGKMLDKHAEEFWKLMETQSGKAWDDLMLEAGIKNIYNLDYTQRTAMTNNMKAALRQKFNDQVIPKIENDIISKQQKQLYGILCGFTKPFNKELHFIIEERVDMTTHEETRYNGCTLAFGKDDYIVTDPAWLLTAPESGSDGEWDDGWRLDFDATDYAWMCAGLPDTIYVFEPGAELIKKNAIAKMSFEQPHATSSRTANINLSESQTWAWRLKSLSINPNYSSGDNVKVTDYSGDYESLHVYWEEKLEDNKVQKYDDITNSAGRSLDFPEEFVYVCFYDDRVEKPSDQSQTSTATLRYNGQNITIPQQGYFPEGSTGSRASGKETIPEAAEGREISVVINRGVYSLVYAYESVPVEEKEDGYTPVINNCENKVEVADFLGDWYKSESNGTVYYTFTQSGDRIFRKDFSSTDGDTKVEIATHECTWSLDEETGILRLNEISCTESMFSWACDECRLEITEDNCLKLTYSNKVVGYENGVIIRDNTTDLFKRLKS